MIKLNLGCGEDIREGFINIDVRPESKPDIVCSLENIPLPNDYADLIVAQDVLEHFNKFELTEVVKEIYRVLKPNGELIIRCPDAEHIVDKYCKKELDINSTLGYLFAGQNYPENTHKIGLTKPIFKSFLELFGFRVIEIKIIDAINFQCIATK